MKLCEFVVVFHRVCLEEAAINTAVLGHCVTDAEAYHALIVFPVVITVQLIGENLETVATVEVIGVNDGERLLNGAVFHKYHLAEPGKDGIIRHS